MRGCYSETHALVVRNHAAARRTQSLGPRRFCVEGCIFVSGYSDLVTGVWSNRSLKLDGVVRAYNPSTWVTEGVQNQPCYIARESSLGYMGGGGGTKLNNSNLEEYPNLIIHTPLNVLLNLQNICLMT